MNCILSLGKIKDTSKYPKQDIKQKKKIKIQKGAGKQDNMTLLISKKFANTEDDLYLQGPKIDLLKSAKEVIELMKKKNKNACKKAEKSLKKFIENIKNGTKPSEEDVGIATFSGFVLFLCKSKYVKETKKDLNKGA